MPRASAPSATSRLHFGGQTHPARRTQIGPAQQFSIGGVDTGEHLDIDTFCSSAKGRMYAINIKELNGGRETIALAGKAEYVNTGITGIA